MPDRIEKTIDLRAPLDRVWRAISDHVEFGEWFKIRFDAPFVVGQIARGQITHPGYEHLLADFRIVAIEPPSRLVYAWHPYAVDPHRDYSAEPETLVEFRLLEIPTGTRLVIVESGFDALPAERHADAFRMNDSGWTDQTLNIQAHVES